MIAQALAFTAPGSSGMGPLEMAHRTAEGHVVKTARGYALFDECGRYLGVLPSPEGNPSFGPGAKTVLLQRDGESRGGSVT